MLAPTTLLSTVENMEDESTNHKLEIIRSDKPNYSSRRLISVVVVFQAAVVKE